MKRLEAIVYGRVQGVYFRQHTEQEARRLDLTGWVANQRDGTVKVIAEGPEAALRQLIVLLHRGSPSARVDKVEITWTTATGEFSRFRTRWF